MAFATCSKEGEEPSEKALIARLRQFVENSDLSFYKIASRIGTSGGILSMWLAGTARPHAEELVAIETFLNPYSGSTSCAKDLAEKLPDGIRRVNPGKGP